MVFSRYDYEGLFSQSNYGVNSGPRWAAVKKNYEQYAVTGLKVKYIPTGVMPTISSGSQSAANPLLNFGVKSLFLFEDVDNYKIASYTEEQIVSLESFKALSPLRQFKVYRNNKPLAREMNVAWQDTN